MIDCGPIGFEFTDDQGNPLDDIIFSVNTDKYDVPNQFVVNRQGNKWTVGEYLIKYRAYLIRYPTAWDTYLEQPFNVTIIEPLPGDFIFNVPPMWLDELEDKFLVLGDNLVYPFGAKVNTYGDEVNVDIDITSIRPFSNYESEINTFSLRGDGMSRLELGIHKVIVNVSYVDPRGRLQNFSNFFYVHIIEDPSIIDLIKGESADPNYIEEEKWLGLTFFEP